MELEETKPRENIEQNNEQDKGKDAEENLLKIENGQKPEIPYPKRVFLILGTEFCERFNYYGMRTVLALYMRNKLSYSEKGATVLYHGSSILVSFMCIFGGIISDVYMGRFRTICILSIVYCFASVLISVSSMPMFIFSPNAALIIGLLLISIGAGGIKPCVSAFGADQFKMPQQSAYFSSYFSLFYASINVGAFLSHAITPILRSDVHCFDQNDCYPLAFGVPAILMFIAIALFLYGKSTYTHVEVSSENMLVQISKCITNAIVTKFRAGRTNPRKKLLDYSIDKYGEELVNDTRILVRIVLLYLPLPFFWTLYDQQGSRWIFQADRMNGDIGFYTLQPEQIGVINPILVLALIPFFEVVVYPLLARIGIRRSLQKIAFGGILAAIAFLLSALLEFVIESSPKKSVSMLWQLPQYVIIAVGEVMFNISGYAFSYEQAPDHLKSVVQTLWLLTNSFGNILLLCIVELSIFESQAKEFLLFSGIMFIDMLIFMILAYRFKSKKIEK